MKTSVPLITILSPSFNQAGFINECIESVLMQGYPNFEHIVIDGGSTDGTLEILKKYKHLKWVSEPDKGLADALNKGLKMATGDIIGWLNTDDYYLPGVFAELVKQMQSPNVKWLIGGIQAYYESSGNHVAVPFKPISYKALRKNCDNMRTPAAFYRKELLDKTGGFNEKLHMVMDYDMYIRLAKISEPLNVDKVFTVFRHHRNQKTTFRNTFKQYKELCSVFRREGLYLAMFLKGTKIFTMVFKKAIKIAFIKTGFLSKDMGEIAFSAKNRIRNK